jgi:hypothetical protein
MVTLPRETFWHKGKRWTRLPVEPYQRFIVGIDLGQANDYTGIGVLEHTITPLEGDDVWIVDEKAGKIRQKFEQRFDVRHLERRPLGELYPDQVAYVQQLLQRPPLCYHDVDVVIDQTGNVGAADIFEAAGLRPVRITFTGGMDPIGEKRKWGVPKSTLVSNLDAKLHCKELRFAKELLEAEALKDELIHFRRNLTKTSRMLFEHRAGKHDDLIFSIAVALWWALQLRRKGQVLINGRTPAENERHLAWARQQRATTPRQRSRGRGHISGGFK